MKQKNWINIFFVTTFLILISIGIWTKLFFPDSISQESNNSIRTNYPPVNSFTDWTSFPSRFDLYLSDNFPVRTEFVQRNSWFRWKLLHQRVFPQVLVGNNGWLYYTSENNISDFQKNNLLDINQIEKIQENINKWALFFKENNIPLVILIAPNKETIYPEYIPSFVQPLGTFSRMDQLITQLKFPDNITVIDPRGKLTGAKQVELVYYKTDTHWNPFGGCITYSILIDSIEEILPIENVLNCKEVEFSNIILSGDLSKMLSLLGVVTEKNLIESIENQKAEINQKNGKFWIVSENPDKNKLHAMIFRDSFFTNLIPLFSENFGHVDYFWTYQIDYDLIKKQRPELVVFEFTERYALEALLETH